MGSMDVESSRHRTVRVLVAEPDGDTRFRYRASFQVAGWDVVDATDGRDALIKALSQRPSLVVTETRLPVLDGYDLCQVLRRDSMTSTVPILVVTAETTVSELDRARAAGADVVLTKPVPPEVLLSEIQRLLKRPEREPRRPMPPLGTPERRMSQAKAHLRHQTTTPPLTAPALVCPSCDRPLTYIASHIGGVSQSHPEQWDRYRCPGVCGTFEYRQRTRKLRSVS